MKIFRRDAIVLAAGAALLLFLAGWYLGRGSEARPIHVETERTLSAAEASVPLPAPTAEPEGGLVHINTADAETLQTLPGIGEKRAADIIAYREENGPFRIPEDLTKVPGIGEGILEQLIDRVTVE